LFVVEEVAFVFSFFFALSGVFFFFDGAPPKKERMSIRWNEEKRERERESVCEKRGQVDLVEAKKKKVALKHAPLQPSFCSVLITPPALSSSPPSLLFLLINYERLAAVVVEE